MATDFNHGADNLHRLFGCPPGLAWNRNLWPRYTMMIPVIFLF